MIAGVVPKNGPDGVIAIVDRAITAGVLKPGRTDSLGRILDLDLGIRPGDTGLANDAFDARATAGDPEHGRPD